MFLMQSILTRFCTCIDQAVKSLTDIWRPESIPPVFATSTQISVSRAQVSIPKRQTLSRHHSLQLLSPCSPSMQSPLPSDLPRPSTKYLSEQLSSATVVSEKDLVPIRTFVHEVLRRSRTTCSVLQSALCYIEAIRRKVPELIEREMQGLGVKGELELDDRILRDTEEDITLSEANNSKAGPFPGVGLETELMPMESLDENVSTVLQVDTSTAIQNELQQTSTTENTMKRRKVPAKPLTPLPPLPSPLLCPRRAFLAALILASKFLQDRCYSNRAWAKLSGLPPREVGRCERALGDALQWRLWVGKKATVPEDHARSVLRTRSESSLTFSAPGATSQVPSHSLSDSSASPEFGRILPSVGSLPTRTSPVSLRRAATLPDETSLRNALVKNRCGAPYPATCTSYAHCRLREGGSLGTQSSSLAPICQLSMTSSEQITPRLSYSPSSLIEPNLDTPSTQYSGIWSPAHSTGSNDSSDSGSSISSVATPPNVPSTFTSSRIMYNSSYLSLGMEYSKSTVDGRNMEDNFSPSVATPMDTTNPTIWCPQVLSTNAFGHSPSSMLDGVSAEIGSQV